MSQIPARNDLAAIMAGPDAYHRMLEWAETGLAEAQVVLGQMLLDGHKTLADPSSALRWFERAADSGHAMAMNMAGRCHENGWGTPPNPEIAAGWFRKAAEAGLDWGMYNYATALALGAGAPMDRQAAFNLLTHAAAMGHVKSMNLLGGFYEDGWATERNLSEARRHYARAAEAGDFRGRFNIARLLLDEGNIDNALAYLRQAYETATPQFRTKQIAFMRASSNPHVVRFADALTRS